MASSKRNMMVCHIYLFFHIITIVFFFFQKGGQHISWKFIEDLYKMATTSMGLTMQHKLKYEHVYLTSFSKMGVDIAAQVHDCVFNLDYSLGGAVCKEIWHFPFQAVRAGWILEYFPKSHQSQ